jgi:diguanylate cyclase (GGDEF)-like protein
MDSASTTRPVPDAAAAGAWRDVPTAIEHLLKATDSASVLDACVRALRDGGLQGHLYWRAPDKRDHRPPGWRIDLAEDTAHQQILALELDAAPSDAARERLAWLGRLADTRLRQLAESSRLYEAISRLALTERLQRALYAIAEQANTEPDLTALMRSLHTIVGSLMYAENFFIALYDTASDSLRFPYYVDTLDTSQPAPERIFPLNELMHGINWHLIRHGKPLIGTVAQLAEQFGGRFELHGPRCEHCIGVPLLHAGQPVGCIVVQSYRVSVQYTRQDLELLTYVAQHVQTALERRSAQVELERRVADRTTALREANRVLRQQVLQRQRGERLQAALFRIAELAGTTDSLEDFYPAVHRVIASLLYARNFYIALIDEEHQLVTFPYSVDEKESARLPRSRGRGATEYVQRTGKPLLADAAAIDRLFASGELSHIGTPSVCWLGVPLSWGDKVRGVLAVQSYTPEHSYTERDQELLTFVSYHVANALQRKQADTALKQAYASLERRVVERTRALGLANRDLREQIAERERIERRLKYETLHDTLTGLPNRTLLLQRLEQALQQLHRSPDALFAVLFIDLDRFKVINDSVGHLVGDDLLFQVGGRIRTCLRTRDVVARLGGDEFAVLLEHVSDAEAAQQIATHILEELQAPFRLGTREIFTSASIGIAMAGTHYHLPEELLRDADSAMYQAKDGGRHRTSLFDDRLRREALSLLRMEGDLRHALARREFVPFYQPIVSLADGHLVGYEALLRWNHPERGMLLPQDFLLIAEDTGCAEAIDWLIFEQTCAQVTQLVGERGYVSINVSGLHFRHADLDVRLLALLERFRVPPHNIRVEVTESTLLDNPEQVKRMLLNLQQQGVLIVLDDFGTGYSSLSYLRQYPFDTLKIDRSFVVGLEEDARGESKAVIRAIQALADSLGMKVIVEGVESAMQQQVLMELGCHYGQGFLFAQAQGADYWLHPGHRLPG